MVREEVGMKTKRELIRNMAATLGRIMAKHGRIEEVPVRFDEGVELTPREIHTVQAVGEQEGINVTDLAARLGVTKSAASQMTAKLARLGFLRKSRTAQNRKEWLLSLTALGRRAFRAHRRVHGKHFDQLVGRLDAFSTTQLAAVGVVLEVVEDVLTERVSQLADGARPGMID